MIKNVLWSSCKVHFILSDFKEYLIFLDIVWKNTQIQNLMKIRSMGDELFHADRRTDRRADMTELTVAFRNFGNAPKNME
jgi:hypothetical protein